MRMSKEVKIALIGATATILAAIITGVFVLKSASSSQPSTSQTASSFPITSNTTQSITQDISTPLATAPANTSASTPTETLTTFCNAMGKGDYPTAYNQLSSRAQQHYGSESSFADTYGLAKITNCTFSNVQQFGSISTATITFIFSSGEKAPGPFNLEMENGVWKIDLE